MRVKPLTVRQLFIVLVAPKNLTQRAASFSNPLRIPRAFLWGFPPQPLTASEIFYVSWLTCISRKGRMRIKKKKKERERKSRMENAPYISKRYGSLFLLSRWSPVARALPVNIKGCRTCLQHCVRVLRRDLPSSSIVPEHCSSLLS